MPAFALRLGLGPLPAGVDEVLHELGSGLQDYEPHLSRGSTDVELSLTIVAGDLWVAVLSAMAAVTGAGYPVVQLDARPAGRPTAVRARTGQGI